MQVARWVELDDGIDPQRYDEFFRNETFEVLLAAGVVASVPVDTKAGGPPHWCQSAEDGPPPPWRFVLQLDAAQYGDGPEPTAEETGLILIHVTRGDDGDFEHDFEDPPGKDPEDVYGYVQVAREGWSVGGPNFGMGTAYVFVNTSIEPASAMMFWQR